MSKYVPVGVDLVLVIWGQYYNVVHYKSYVCYDTCNPSYTWREDRKVTEQSNLIEQTYSFDVDGSGIIGPPPDPDALL